MGYRLEKEKAERKSRRLRTIVCIILIVAIAGLCVFSAFCPPSEWKYYVRLPDIPSRGEGELRIHFLDVGQGDCSIIEFPDGRTMIIDGGNGQEENTSRILRYANALKIDRFDFMLLTHADSDHCGGLEQVLDVKGAGRVYMPDIRDPSVNDRYAAFYAVLAENGETERGVSHRYLQISSRSEDYPYTLTFLSPYRSGNPGSLYDKINSGDYTDTDMNDSSAVVWLGYAGTGALFCGDISSEVEKRLIGEYELGFFDGYGVALENTEILKVSHHGSGTATDAEFLRFLGVKTSVISCGADNVYGHPSPEVCDRLLASGAELFRTDRDGNVMITVSSDGSYSTAISF